MAKCEKCGKRGLFLKVNAFGYCSDCARAMRELDATNRRARAEARQKQAAPAAPAKAPSDGNTFTVVGVTFNTGKRSRQTILRQIYFKDPPFEETPEITLARYKFEGEDAVGVYADGLQVGNIAKKDLPWVIKYWNEDLQVQRFNVYGGREHNWGMEITIAPQLKP